MAKILMVVGLMFADMNRVVLIEKQKPEWQAGLLNGPGGVVKEGETPLECLVRKVEAETGIKTTEKGWKPVNVLFDGEAQICIYAINLNAKQVSSIASPTNEHTGLYYTAKLSAHKTVPNIQWLVPFAYTTLNGPDKQVGITSYNDTDLTKQMPTAPTFYAVINSDEDSNVTVVSRDLYISKGMSILKNAVLYAGTEAETNTWASQYTKDAPYPVVIVDSLTAAPEAKPSEPSAKLIEKEVAPPNSNSAASTTTPEADVTKAADTTVNTSGTTGTNDASTASTPGSGKPGDTTKK